MSEIKKIVKKIIIKNDAENILNNVSDDFKEQISAIMNYKVFVNLNANKNDMTAEDELEIQNINPKLWKDVKFCKKMLEENEHSLKYISPEIIKENFSEFSPLLKYINIDLIFNYLPKDFILNVLTKDAILFEKIIRKDSSLFREINEDIRLNKEFIENLVKEEKDFKEFIDEKLYSDEEFMIKILLKNNNIVYNKEIMKIFNFSSEIIEQKWDLLSNKMKDYFFKNKKINIMTCDEKIIIDAYYYDYDNFFKIYPELSSRDFSENFIKEFAINNYASLPTRYKQDINLINYLVERRVDIWGSIPKEFQDSKVLILKILEYDDIWMDLKDEYKNDFEIIIQKILYNGLSTKEMKEFDSKLFENEIFAKALILNDLSNYKHLGESQKKNREIINYMLSKDFDTYPSLPMSIKMNVEFNIELINNDLIKNSYLIENKMLYNPDFFISFITNNLYSLAGFLYENKENINNFYKNKEIIQRIHPIIEADVKNTFSNHELELYYEYFNKYRCEDLQSKIIKVKKEENNRIRKKV